MSAVMGSSTDTAVVLVRLLEEGTDVWRPVAARHVGGSIYRLGSELIPDDLDEVWAFQPGDMVVAETRVGAGRPSDALFAVARVSELDAEWRSAHALAG